jgi:hypothetical protein
MSPFQNAHKGLSNFGFHVLPIKPRDKRILEINWAKYCSQKATPERIDAWALRPEANIGVALGSPVTTDHGVAQLVAVDIDTLDPVLFDQLISVLPPSPMAKKGAKGLTLFYIAPLELQSFSIPKTLDFLASGRQTVMPPSIHPDGMAYEYQGDGLIPANELPYLTQANIDELRAICASPTPAPRPVYAQSTGDLWQDVNQGAMDNLSAWLDAIGLVHLVRTGQRYAAVAHWRSGGTGRSLDKRKRNLSIHRQGIKDFGTGETFSPIDLVMVAMGKSDSEALNWLADRLGLKQEYPMITLANREVETEIVAVQQDEELNQYDFPDNKLMVGGLVQWGADLAMERMPYPNRLWATLATMMALGTILGRKVTETKGRVPTRLYSIIYGDTGIGKQAPQDIIMGFLSAAGCIKSVSTDQTSAVALAGQLMLTPNTIQIVDEVDTILSQFASARTDNAKYTLMTAYNNIWGATEGSFSVTGSSARQGGHIYRPNLSLFWATVTGDFHKNLSEKLFTNGFLNRFGVFPRYSYVKENENKKPIDELPSDFVEALKFCFNARANSRDLIHQQDPNGIPIPFVLGYAREAYDLIDLWRKENSDKVQETGRVDKEFIVRRIRQIQTIALIIACGKHYLDLENGFIDVDDLMHARDLVDWSTEQLKIARDSHMVSSLFQAQCHIVVKTMPKNKWITRRELGINVKTRFKKRELDEIMEVLIESGQVQVKEDVVIKTKQISYKRLK